MNSAPAHADKISLWSRRRSEFRAWRQSRPFWGGLLATAAGLEILIFPLVTLPVLIEQGIAGISGFVVGILMVVTGLSLWFQPHLRTFAGIATILLALVSFITANLGGLVVGLLLGVVGGALGFSWVETKPEPAGTDEQQFEADSEQTTVVEHRAEDFGTERAEAAETVSSGTVTASTAVGAVAEPTGPETTGRLPRWIVSPVPAEKWDAKRAKAAAKQAREKEPRSLPRWIVAPVASPAAPHEADSA